MAENQNDTRLAGRLWRMGADPRIWCAALAVVACAYIALWTAGDVLRLYHPLPFWDYWDFMATLPRYQSGEVPLLDLLWAQHSEHRILFPRLVYLADAVWFGGSGACNVVLSCLLQAGHALLLGSVVASSCAGPRAVRVLAAAAVTGCMLGGGPSVNLWWAFQVPFVLVYVAMTLSLWQLARQRVGPVQLIAAVLLGFIATGSMANGLLVWPLLWSLAIARRLPRRSILFLVAAGAVVIFVYLKGFETWDNPSPLRALLTPVRLLEGLCLLLGNPLWSLGTAPAITGGIITLVLALWSVLRRVRCWFQMTAAEALLVHLVLLVLGTAMLIAAGRAALPLEEMSNSRYGTPVLLLWAALLGLGFAGSRSVSPRWWMVAVATTFVAGLGCLAPTYRGRLEPMHDIQVYASACLLSGVMDTQFLRQTHDVPVDWTVISANVLRQRHLSVFRTGLQYLIGTDLMEHFGLDPDAQAISYTTVPLPVEGHPGAGRIDGWSHLARTGLPPDLILVVDENLRITGLGFARRPHENDRDQRQLQWRAWVREADHPGRQLSIYGIWNSAAVLIARSPGKVNEVQAEPLIDDFAMVGPAATLTGLELTGSWSGKGWHPSSPEPPLATLALGSWSGADGGTGTLRASISARGDDAVLLVPLLTGHDASGVMLRILHERSRTVRTTLLAPRPFMDRWRLWRVPLPALDPSDRWILEARDLGRSWGQWFAVGAPHWEVAPAPR